MKQKVQWNCKFFKYGNKSLLKNIYSTLAMNMNWIHWTCIFRDTGVAINLMKPMCFPYCNWVIHFNRNQNICLNSHVFFIIYLCSHFFSCLRRLLDEGHSLPQYTQYRYAALKSSFLFLVGLSSSFSLSIIVASNQECSSLVSKLLEVVMVFMLNGRTLGYKRWGSTSVR